MYPEVYGWQHITYMLISICLMILGIWATKKFTKKDSSLVLNIKITAGVLLFMIIANRVSISIKEDNWLYLLPNTYCGVSSFVLALCVLFTKRDSAPMHFIFYMGFVGTILTFFYPDFIGQAETLFFIPTLTGLLHHTIGLYLILLMFATGYFKPSVKKWYAIPLGLCCYMSWGLFLYDIIGLPAFEINEDFEGIAGMTWLYAGLIFVALYTLFITIYEVVTKRKSKHVKKV